MLTNVTGKTEKDHCNKACKDEKSGKHDRSPKQKSLEAVELRTGNHHNQLPTHHQPSPVAELGAMIVITG